jgi:hypothetical protein
VEVQEKLSNPKLPPQPQQEFLFDYFLFNLLCKIFLERGGRAGGQKEIVLTIKIPSKAMWPN